MSDGVADSAAPEVSEEVTRLAELGRKGTVEFRDPLAPKTFERPAGVPEKFWDPLTGAVNTEALLKSYTELEKLRSQPKQEEVQTPAAEADTPAVEEKPEEDPEEQPEGEAEGEPEGQEDGSDDEAGEENGDEPPALTSAIEAAQAAYAETGELSAEAREPLLAQGISNEQIDFYLQGVKAAEQALYSAAYEAAGGEETYKEAVQWASTNWSEKQIAAFNAATGDPQAIKMVVKGLVSEFREANPGEGRLTNINTGVSRGDVYNDIREFHADLAKADATRDQLARSKAVDKLRRSREAKTIVSNRRQPFGN